MIIIMEENHPKRVVQAKRRWEAVVKAGDQRNANYGRTTDLGRYDARPRSNVCDGRKIGSLHLKVVVGNPLNKIDNERQDVKARTKQVERRRTAGS